MRIFNILHLCLPVIEKPATFTVDGVEYHLHEKVGLWSIVAEIIIFMYYSIRLMHMHHFERADSFWKKWTNRCIVGGMVVSYLT